MAELGRVVSMSWQASMRQALDDERGWVVDGNYESKLGLAVIDRAQVVIWLDLPLFLKLARLLRRTFGRIFFKHELWNGNRESLKNAFWGREALFVWAVRTHFRHKRTWPARFQGKHLVRLRSADEVARWLAAVDTQLGFTTGVGEPWLHAPPAGRRTHQASLTPLASR